MNLSNPLESLMRPLDANALLAVWRVGRLTGRQVARVIGSNSPNATRDALVRLVTTGLLHASPEPHATYYSVNERHLLWPAVRQIIDATQHFEEELRNWSAEHAPAGSSVLLYGSSVSGRATGRSDIDLLVVFPDGLTLDERDDFTERLSRELSVRTGNRVEIYDLTQAQLSDMDASEDPMVASWREEAKLISGPMPPLLQRVLA